MATKAVAQATSIVGAQSNVPVFNSQQKAVDGNTPNIKSTTPNGVQITKDGYEIRGTIVNISICSNVDVDQTVSIFRNYYHTSGYPAIESDVPISIGANAVMELTGLCLENDITLLVSCTEGVDVFVYGLADLGVA